MKLRRWGVVAALLLMVLPRPATAIFPYGIQPGGVYDYSRLHIKNGTCEGVPAGQPRPARSDLPGNFDCRGTWKLSDYAARPGEADYDALVNLNPQEFLGVRGPGTNRAWETTTGRPDTVIAVMDSGIRWDEERPELMRKFALNRGELPKPSGSGRGGSVKDYDANGDGVFNVSDYARDPRARENPLDANKLLDPGDLIRAFSDGVDDDNNGYVDDISGWDFFEGDNDPNDDVDYGHGTGESEDAAGEIGSNLTPQCPNCMLMEMRVGDSFVADANHFAAASVYAVDNGASVIQSALGALNNTSFAQAAIDYAYHRGVLLVASAADESAGHHNQPSALNHSMVVNSINRAEEGIQKPATWLSFNGCTNFGGYIWVSVPSSSCSSDAVGQSAGMAGLVYSAARNAVQKGVIKPDVSGQPLSAEEAKQLFRLASEDIDFSTPKPPGPPNNFVTSLPLSQRFVTTAGWDQISGWGRIRSDDLVRLVSAGHIPPEADITSPRWWQPLPVTGSVKVEGRVAAPRAGKFTWEVQYAPGVQPPRWPLSEKWTTVKSATAERAIEGELATINLADVRSAINRAVPPYTPADDPTARSMPERDAFRIRVVVKTGDHPWQTAIAQHQAFAHDDPTLLSGWPRFLDADGSGSPAFEDLDNDGRDELVIGDGNGFVHAFKANGTEAAGWPVHTRTIDLPTRGKNAFTRGELSGTVHSAILAGAPLIADLDGDGSPEVGVGDLEGDLHVWSHDGKPVKGFPVQGKRAFSYETACQVVRGACDDDGPADVRDHLNTVDRAFTSQPVAANLDPSFAGLELLASSNDGHIYAWHADGSPVAGWPVLLRDPAKVKAVDPVTHRVTYTPDANAHFGRKVLPAPSVGDVDGDGDLEVAANVNEEYKETPNTVDPVIAAVGLLNDVGNTRTYLLHHDGTAHAPSARSLATPHPDDQAYVNGWPVPIAMLSLELLPYVGEGSNGQPVMADVDGDGTLEIGTASIGSPPYLLEPDGSSSYGESGGRYRTGASTVPGVGSTATDLPSIASLGGGVFGRVGAGPRIDFAMSSSGLRRLLDIILPEQQLLAEDHISVWNTKSGAFEPGFPAQMNDLQFTNTPTILDVTGDGQPEVVASSAMYDLQAYGEAGQPAAGFPKFTGGWSVSAASAGDMDGDGDLELALATREGNLFVWQTAGSACQPQEWPKAGHDLRNTGAYGTDGDRPGSPSIVGVERAGDEVVVRFSGAGDDGRCGAASKYRVTAGANTVEVPSGATEARVAAPATGKVKVSLLAVDDAGNAGFAASMNIGIDRDGGTLPATGEGADLVVPTALLAMALAVRRLAARR